MARELKLAVTQMRCGVEAAENISRAEALVRRAAGQGANLVLLQELFETPYFCQDQAADNLSGSQLQESFLSSPWITRIESLGNKTVAKKATYPAGLTRREVEVLRLVANGATNQQVADKLHISVRTVNTHMTNILNKTGCDNRTAASSFAARHNLLTT